jgi:hypothetical protein
MNKQQLPAPLTVTKYSSRGSIYSNQFGSEIISEDIAAGVSLCVFCSCRFLRIRFLTLGAGTSRTALPPWQSCAVKVVSSSLICGYSICRLLLMPA